MLQLLVCSLSAGLLSMVLTRIFLPGTVLAALTMIPQSILSGSAPVGSSLLCTENGISNGLELLCAQKEAV